MRWLGLGLEAWSEGVELRLGESRLPQGLARTLFYTEVLYIAGAWAKNVKVRLLKCHVSNRGERESDSSYWDTPCPISPVPNLLGLILHTGRRTT